MGGRVEILTGRSGGGVGARKRSSISSKKRAVPGHSVSRRFGQWRTACCRHLQPIETCYAERGIMQSVFSLASRRKADGESAVRRIVTLS